jgi:predicted HicB family RNase H-like nuclease
MKTIDSDVMVRIEQELYKEIRILAVVSNQGVKGLVEKAIREYLDNHLKDRDRKSISEAVEKAKNL